jgi:hypothetical protein
MGALHAGELTTFFRLINGLKEFGKNSRGGRNRVDTCGDGAYKAPPATNPGVWGGSGLPAFFDNCIFDGRDTLAAPLCFLHVSAGSSLGTMSDCGWSWL